MQWMTIFNAQSLESWRNFKWIWVPLVFILLGLMDPLTTYYLPQILDSVGGLPEGATIDIPTPPPTDVIMMSIGQFNMIGVAVIVLISMGAISGERKSGKAELILVKPVNHMAYITAKWASFSLLNLTAVYAGLLSSWYYVSILFENIPFTNIIMSGAFYSLWILFITAVNFFMNTLVKIPGLVAFLTIAVIIVMQIFSQIFQHIIEWLPNLIPNYMIEIIETGNVPSELWGASSVTVLLMVVLLIGASYSLKTKEMS
ncbi:ABC transporter permease [Halobacillus sp. A1]|uniref:ABC transporter permease n=1 Tax=Halobacillus sp. A1 TaxID=2880262 RepID=UPI0020A65D1A|nr:ABC transporter permease [Halobacillus sp. A1]MCP3030228.1 ABC transporter permease [Halobacillus sp. A1]